MTEQRPTLAGPTFEEMLHPDRAPSRIRRAADRAEGRDPLDPANLFNIRWRDREGRIRVLILPPELTGAEATIVALHSVDFPTGSHKVGAAYAVAVELAAAGEIDPGSHTLVWPSTGNYGIGGAWVGGRMGFSSAVVLPEGMSRERFERISEYGASIVQTPGTESNVREIYERTRELASDPAVRVLNQFEAMGNYRFHFHVTGNTGVELAADLKAAGIGRGRVAAFVSAMGSAGTIAAGDRMKALWPDLKIVGLEPIQCPTLYNNGYGAHEIQGIGDKHVTWIHHVTNMDAVMCIDDVACLKVLELVTSRKGMAALESEAGIPAATIAAMGRVFGISGVCNLLGAVKAARHFRLGASDVVLTVCTDGIDRYRSVMADLPGRFGTLNPAEARRRIAMVREPDGEWIREGTPENRRQWHNLKYFTWVEQQGRTVEELDAQLDEAWWRSEQEKVRTIDRWIEDARKRAC